MSSQSDPSRIRGTLQEGKKKSQANIIESQGDKQKKKKLVAENQLHLASYSHQNFDFVTLGSFCSGLRPTGEKWHQMEVKCLISRTSFQNNTYFSQLHASAQRLLCCFVEDNTLQAQAAGQKYVQEFSVPGEGNRGKSNRQATVYILF